jgi:hypothetical protein
MSGETSSPNGLSRDRGVADPEQVTQLLADWSQGDQAALYNELHNAA